MSFLFKVGGYQLRASEGAAAASSSNARTLDFSAHSAFAHALTENVTFTCNNMVAGGAYIIRVSGHASTGPYTVEINGVVASGGITGGSRTWENSTGVAPAAVPATKELIISIYCSAANVFHASFVGNYAA